MSPVPDQYQSVQMELTGLLLCGGEGRRMGGNKPWREYRGQPLYTWPLAVLQTTCRSVLSVGAPLPGCVHVPDERPGLGPLGGLLSGLRASPTDWCLLAAADMPALDAETIATLWEHRQRPATVPVLTAPEPLLALYHRELVPSLEAYLESRRSARGWLETLEYKKVPGLPPETFRNVNYPEELEGRPGTRTEPGAVDLP